MSSALASDRSYNHLLATLPDATLEPLKRHLSVSTLPQGAICFDAGDIVERAYFPTSGLISLFVSTGGNNFVEAGMVGSEGAAGLQSAVWSRPSYTRATVQVAGKFLSVSAGPLRQAIQSNEEAKAVVIGYTEMLWAEAQQLAGCNAVHPALRRLARWLLQAADRSQSNEIALTQKFLAEMLGVRRTSVTMLANRLQDRGIIKCGRGTILILDRAALEDAACPCYQMIKQLHRREST